MPPVRSNVGTSAHRAFRPALEALEAREVPARYDWLGTVSTDALNPANWLSSEGPNALPGEDDHLHFGGMSIGTGEEGGPPSPGGGTSVNCDNLQSLGDGFAGVYIGSSYIATVTMGEALTFGVFDLANGAISQSASAFDLTVTGTFNWTGGVLNSSAVLAQVYVSGSSAVADFAPTGYGTVTFGSGLTFTDGAVATMRSGTFTAANEDAELTITDEAELFVDAPNQITIDSSIRFFGSQIRIGATGFFTLVKGDFAIAAAVSNSGTFTIHADQSVSLGEVTVDKVEGGPSFKHSGGSTRLYGGATLGCQFGYEMSGGEITVHLIHGGYAVENATAKLQADVKITGGDIKMADRVLGDTYLFGELWVNGDVTWTGGTYRPAVSADSADDGDHWHASGTFTIGGTATIAPGAVDGEGNVVLPPTGMKWGVLSSNVPIIRANGTPTVAAPWGYEMDALNKVLKVKLA